MGADFALTTAPASAGPERSGALLVLAGAANLLFLTISALAARTMERCLPHRSDDV